MAMGVARKKKIKENGNDEDVEVLDSDIVLPNYKEEEDLVTKKILLKPTKEEKKVLDDWFGVANFLYNYAVEDFKENGKIQRSQKDLRDSLLEEDPGEWINDVPYEIKDGSFADFVKAVKINKDKQRDAIKNGKQFNFDMNFRNKRNKSISIFYKVKML